MSDVRTPIQTFRPLLLDKARENEMSRRMYRVLLRWVPFANEQYAEWPDRPNCGHFFGGAYWYEQETAFTAAIFATLAKLGEYDEAVTGVPRRELMRKAIAALRYLCFTHDTGPEECVRVLGPNPYCSGKKWGGAGDDFFRASQTGTSVAAIGKTAWLLWDELDEETKALVQNVLVYYADRWSDEPPRNGVYFNTQCEENGWTAGGISAAAVLLPEHPRNAHWNEAFKRWAINSVSTFRDEIEQWPYVSTATFHPDYTAENHAFVHPNYMTAGITLRGQYALFALMAGIDIPEQALSRNVEMYDRTIKAWALSDGIAAPLQGQDWWYNRQHGELYCHAFMNVIHGDPEAALLERRSLDVVERLQLSNDRGCLLEENGEKYIVWAPSHQTAKEMEFGSAYSILNAYLLHLFGGPGVEPSDEATLARKQSGVRLYPYGCSVVYRTPDTFTAFSWRNHVLALSMPAKGLWSVTPIYTSYTGTVEFAGLEPNRLRNEDVVLDTVREDICRHEHGFGATVMIARGPKETVHQDVGFVALPDGRSVYVERWRVRRACEIRRLKTGTIGIRNERYRELPDWARGEKKLYLPGESRTYRGFYGEEPNVVDSFGPVPYLNVDDEIGFVVFGSAGMSYLNQHEYAKWKGVEDILTLNEWSDRRFAGPENTAPFCVVNLPNRTAAETAEAAKRTFRLDGTPDGAVVLETDEYLVYANFADSGARVTATRSHAADTVVQLFDGAQTVTESGYTWSGTLPAFRSGWLERRFTFRLLEPPAAFAVEIHVAGEQLFIRNEGETELRATVDGADGRTETIRLAPRVWVSYPK